MIKMKCKLCKKIFYASYWDSKRRKYCEKKCFYKAHSRNMSGKNHPLYGTHPTKYTLEKMSNSHKGRIGSKSNTWKGGRLVKGQRYILIHSPNHPYKTKGNYVYEHRLVMEKHLGRYLKPSEVVHHINGNKHDNRIENLKFYKNESEHRRSHPLIKNGKHLITLTI